MSVSWNQAAACYEWRCLFGCYAYDFESQQEATDSFLAHRCSS